MSHDSSTKSPEAPRASRPEKYDELDANIRNFAPVARIMKNALPDNAKIAKEAKECMQECVSEFISFITSEGTSTPSTGPIRARVPGPSLSSPSPASLLTRHQLRRNAIRRSGKPSTAKTSCSP
jgi:hypothetical protein